MLGTSTATHLSLLIAPPALQTIADKNSVDPESIISACNADIVTFLSRAISFGKGPADAVLSIASHCSLRRLTASAFASFYIRFEILTFLFAPTSTPDKLLARAFCSAIQNSRVSSHLSSLDCREWRALAQFLKQAILQREALEPFFGPHRDPEVVSRADGFRESQAVRNAPPSPHTPSPAAPVQPRTQSQQPVQRSQPQAYPAPPRHSNNHPQSPSSQGGDARSLPRMVAAHSAQVSIAEPEESAVDNDAESQSSEGSYADE